MVVRPARALGAPQTISFMPSTVSTWQTCRRSALGWRSAETMRATVKGARAAMGSWTSSTSSPAMVMASATAATSAVVSRCSFSQDRVNFIASARLAAEVGDEGVHEGVVAGEADADEDAALEDA